MKINGPGPAGPASGVDHDALVGDIMIDESLRVGAGGRFGGRLLAGVHFQIGAQRPLRHAHPALRWELEPRLARSSGQDQISV
ncbi:hypothetical protein ACWDXH_23080 [Micromonospora chokoriensis]